MRPFDLEKAKAGAPVCTRDGRPVRIVCFDRQSAIEHSIVALAKSSENYEEVATYRSNGMYDGGDSEHPLDLFMATEKKQGWMALFKADGFPDNVLAVTSSVYASKEEVEAFIRDMRELDPAAAKELIEIRQIELEE